MIKEIFMFRLMLFFLIACITSSSCNNSANFAKSSLRDSVANLYLLKKDSKPNIDTSEAGYRLFKAYFTNDTNSLVAYLNKRKDDSLLAQELSIFDSCVHQYSLEQLPIDEAYRFKYWQAFCLYKTIITITKTGNIVKLELITYQSDMQKDNCVLADSFSRQISIENWEGHA